jgi:DNA-binding MarR family transcriptional regulator
MRAGVDVEPVAVRLAQGLSRTAVALELAGGRVSDGLERTVAQQLVLLHLRRHRHRAAVIADFAAELAMSVDDTVTAVGTLAREGLVALSPAPSYAPADVRVELTDVGRAQDREMLNWAADLLVEMEQLSDDDQLRLMRLVRERIGAMQWAGQIPVTRMCVTCRFFDPYAHPGTSLPHHCHLVDAPFGHRQLRLRCPDQRPPQPRDPQ